MPKSKLEDLLNHLPDGHPLGRTPGCKYVWRYEGGWQEWSEKNYPIE